jgi:hypothetical protein
VTFYGKSVTFVGLVRCQCSDACAASSLAGSGALWYVVPPGFTRVHLYEALV